MVGIKSELFDVLSQFLPEETGKNKENVRIVEKKPKFLSFLSQIILYQINLMAIYLPVPEMLTRLL